MYWVNVSNKKKFMDAMRHGYASLVWCVVSNYYVMKTVRIGNVPLEWFTGAGELRSHDKACNDMTREEAMSFQAKGKRNVEREIILALRKERKESAKLKKLGIDYTVKTIGKGISIRDITGAMFRD
jgi:hypothetical protein